MRLAPEVYISRCGIVTVDLDSLDEATLAATAVLNLCSPSKPDGRVLHSLSKRSSAAGMRSGFVAGGADKHLGHLPGYFRPPCGFFLWLRVDDGAALTPRLWAERALDRAVPFRGAPARQRRPDRR